MKGELIGIAIVSVAAALAARWAVGRAVGAWLVLVLAAPIGGWRP